MKYSALLRLKEFGVYRKIATWLLVPFGLTASSFAQVDDPETVALWREWMAAESEFREPDQPTSPRVYLRTMREVLQTGPEQAQLQNGSFEFILADGAAPDVDGDRDGYTDMMEYFHPSDYDDEDSIPLDARGNPLPQDAAFVVGEILLGNGKRIGISDSITLANRSSTIQARKGDGAVRIIGAPYSQLKKPFPFRDLSGLFLFTNEENGTFHEFPLSLYYEKVNYPSSSGAGSLETTIVPGEYKVEFPTIQNPPLGKAAIGVAHRLVPNGSLTVGQKKPTWLLRSLKSDERNGKPLVEQPWVNGRLKFDPYLTQTLKWDTIYPTLASPLDRIEVRFIDAESGYSFGRRRVSAVEAGISVDNNPYARDYYGNIRERMEEKRGLRDPDLPPLPALPVNGYIEMEYFRTVSGLNSADLSRVTVLVPIQMEISYASWRLELFGSDAQVDSIAGPNVDPDGDGLTNQQEFEQGSDPLVSAVGVTNATSQNIDLVTATLGATVVRDSLVPSEPDIFEQGVIYSVFSTNSSPVIDGIGVNRVVSSSTGMGTFMVDVTGLSPGTKYAFRGYVITSAGTFYTVPVSTFTTLSSAPITLPTVTSPSSSSITSDTAILGGNVTSDGGSTITGVGVVYSVTSENDNPFIGGAGVSQVTSTGGTGVFNMNITGLTPSTTYSFRAYAVNGVGTSYTSTIGSFTTPAPVTFPTVISPTSANVAAASATLGGNVTSNGGAPITQRGIVFSVTSINPDPTIGDGMSTTFSASTAGLGVFTVNATGLAPGTNYSFKAFARNSQGISYTEDVGSFTTSSSLPTVAEPTLEGITSSSATLGANVTDGGSSSVTERGFVYSPTATNNNPVIGGTGVIKVPVSGATGFYSATIFGLTANTSYTFKPYATNGAGTAYGTPWAFFTTLPPLTVSSPTVADVTVNSATLGGTVESDGGTTVDERGVVYSTDSSVAPAIGGPGVTKIVGPGTMGVFTVGVTGLASETTHYFRAYATSGATTSYSAVSSFTTLAVELLGQSQVQWAQAETPILQSNSDSGGESTSSGKVPQFIYVKSAKEAASSYKYQIEISTNAANWSPIDKNQWSVEETSSMLVATWNSSGELPDKLFFRVSVPK